MDDIIDKLCWWNSEHPIDDLDDLIDEWHKSNSDKPIYEYLGLYQEQYRNYVKNGEIELTGCQIHCPYTRNICRLHGWECNESQDRKIIKEN